ncbi:efflux RND transporter periplasmic adaptor subunit [Niabella drilacis]|uniref:RND family efflux transporter, MFP subunit n=1 Tax=Niabella drilacis (strain DSM 25811 / CCM 8410 / CCUG 62505 / LMG 26954 / E90) TaxID=1285928 RepID=A0A1G6IKU3_NIADE|nr:efflux RND transporter periplasmic adaptor subunit [Niabella drilacis]SDC07108.1 RND family efflux transporter, MFP subunit [Niabella drilacis]
MTRILTIALMLFCLSGIISCGNKPGAETVEKEEHGEEAGEHSNENTTTLTAAQMEAIGVQLGGVERKELTNSIKANGILTVPNQNKAFVVPLYSGVIKTLHVQPGSFVKQGQAIATIVNPDLIQMQQQLQQVEAQIALSEMEVKRQQELVEGNAAPLKRLQQAQTELATLRSQRNGWQKQLSAVGATRSFSSAIVVRAPIGGTVSKVSAQLGSNVDVSTPIAEIVNNSQLHLDLYVYEKDLPRLRSNQTIHFTITNNAGKEYDAEIFSIGAAFEAGSKTIPVHAKVIGDKAGLIDGMNVTALVSLDKSTVPAVPSDAIVSYQGKDFIFVVTGAYPEGGGENSGGARGTKTTPVKQEDTHENEAGGLIFERIPVAKGTTDVGYSEVTLLKEIPADAKIVIKGAFFILAKMTNSGAHEH